MTALAETTDATVVDAPTDRPILDAPVADGSVADDAIDAAPAENPRKPGAMRFRRKFATVRLTPEQATRQGQVATSAFRAFGNRDAAVAFLNGHDETLGGRPLDLAIASAEGLAEVEAAMAGRQG